MASTPQFNTAQIEQQIDSILIGVLRIILSIFFAVVVVTSFVFAIVVTCVALFAVGLKMMLRFVAQRAETRAAFALAGLA